MSGDIKALRMLEDYYPGVEGIADRMATLEAALRASTELLRAYEFSKYESARNQIAANEAALKGGKNTNG